MSFTQNNVQFEKLLSRRQIVSLPFNEREYAEAHLSEITNDHRPLDSVLVSLSKAEYDTFIKNKIDSAKFNSGRFVYHFYKNLGLHNDYWYTLFDKLTYETSAHLDYSKVFLIIFDKKGNVAAWINYGETEEGRSDNQILVSKSLDMEVENISFLKGKKGDANIYGNYSKFKLLFDGKSTITKEIIVPPHRIEIEDLSSWGE
jgi:hypothetical protein